MITKKDLGIKIKELRQKAGLSQEQLGKALGKSHAAISDIERGDEEEVPEAYGFGTLRRLTTQSTKLYG